MSPTSGFNQDLDLDLQALEAAGLRRSLREIASPQGPHVILDGKGVLNFSSNDYLGLAAEPALKRAAIQAVETFGAGAGASRLISGSLAPLHRLEETLAQFKRTEACLAFSTGYAAALGTIGALVSRDDILILDKLVHACVVDAARLSGATLRIFRHNDLDNLEKILVWASARAAATTPRLRNPRVIIVTESVFSMDGDLAPLKEIVELKDRHGAWLMLDEAHATGLFGPGRRGLAEACGVADRIEIQMGTLGKALGAAGGYICGSRKLVDLLVNRARSFIFSTAPVPAAAAAAAAAVEQVSSEFGAARCRQLWERVHQLQTALAPAAALPSPIVPLILGAEAAAVSASRELLARGLFVPAIRYPTVARGAARLRISLSASHEPAHVGNLLASLQELGLRPLNLSS
jgi:8-amino-7-oxononanoate synthase